MLVRLANQRSRFNAEQLHDFVTVQIRADRVEILLLLQIAHALFHLVHRRREHHGLALVLRGRVGTRQAVQTLVQRACVFDVTANRRIRPRLLHVSVETQVKVDQFADVLDHMMIEMQCLKALAGHFRADRIMMMETHLAARFETTRLRLADIVHERGKTQRQVWSWHRTVRAGFESDSTINDDHGVLEHVLMTMMFVDFELQCRNFREDDIRKTGIDQRFDTCTRSIGQQHFDQFVTYALGGNDFNAIDHVGQRFGGFRFDAEAQLRHETYGAHHAQRIVIERLARIDRRAQHALGQIVRAAERIDKFQFGHAQCHGVHREITAGKIAFQRVAIINFRLARVGVIRVGTVSRYLNLHFRAILATAHRTQRAEFASHIPKAITPKTAQNMFKLLRTRRRAKIQIMRFTMQQQVPDGTSHQRQFIAFRGEHTP